jgi:hypothetical protein
MIMSFKFLFLSFEWFLSWKKRELSTHLVSLRSFFMLNLHLLFVIRSCFGFVKLYHC